MSSVPRPIPSDPRAANRASKITVEYHRPSRESIQEYNDLLAEANLHAAAAAAYHDPFLPSPTNTKSRNSLQKPPPRKRSLKDHDPFAAHPAPVPEAVSMAATSPPPRPSRANTATLNDLFAAQPAPQDNRISDPINRGAVRCGCPRQRQRHVYGRARLTGFWKPSSTNCDLDCGTGGGAATALILSHTESSPRASW